MKSLQEKLLQPQILVAKLLRGKRTSECVKTILRENNIDSEIVQGIIQKFAHTGNYP